MYTRVSTSDPYGTLSVPYESLVDVIEVVILCSPLTREYLRWGRLMNTQETKF